MAAPNQRELEVLRNFRENVKDVVGELPSLFQTDIMMMAWLRARNLNIPQAEEMMRKSLEWRKSIDLYNLCDLGPPKGMMEEFPFELSGYTSEGYPVIVVQLGKWDIRKVVEAGDRELLVKYILYLFSYLIKICLERSSPPDNIVSQFVCIVDAQGFSIRQVADKRVVETAMEVARQFEANFPETLKQCFIVNAPRIFPIIFAIVKPILSANTVEKIQIYGGNAKKWKPAIRNSIPADQYPQRYGGTKLQSSGTSFDNDSLNRQLSDGGADEELISISVAAGDTYEIDFDITCPSSTLCWTFKTDNYDIGFSINRDGEEIQSMEKYESHLEKQEGSIVCETTGRYCLVWDNSYSRLRSKSLYYMVSLNIGDDEMDDWDECTSL